MRVIGTAGGFGVIVVALAAAGAGCGASDQPVPTAPRIAAVGSVPPSPPPGPAAESAAAAPQQPAGGEDAALRAAAPAAAGRKIIYNSRVDLIVEDLNPFERALTELLATQGAYVADSERTGSAGSVRRGRWKIRVPADGYDVFLRGVTRLGELVSVKADSQDVSEEYIDLEARQAAKRVEEARLLKHLTDSTGKLEEILTVERELSRVRTEVERMQGRLRALANLAAMGTVTINATEATPVILPPPPTPEPTYAERLSRTFADSVAALRHFGEELLLVVVALTPWLPLIALGVWVVVLVVRRLLAYTGPT